ncbi:MAG TPA: acyltransferase family protein [Candidatus Barnesiella excrementavium]|nr:acyltransferase family protein [Candidatus Barnesiella excrementavium]
MSEVTVKQRDKSIDIAKGIGIILVVYGHLACPIKEEIYLFHMPLFFLLSGYFFSIKESLRDFLVKKTKALLLPFCLFYALSFIYSYFYGAHDNLKDFVYSFKSFTDVDGPLWFLLSLYEIFIICFIVEKYLHSSIWKFVIAILITLLGYLMAMKKIFIPFCYLSQAFLGYAFFYFGFQIKRYGVLLHKSWSKYIVVLSIIFYGIGIVRHVLTEIRWLIIDHTYILFFLPALGGSLLVIYISRYLQDKRYARWLAYLGKNSLLIMCVHMPLVRLVYAFLLPGLRYYYSLIGNSTVTDGAMIGGRICSSLTLIILVPLSLYVGLLIKKIFPFCFVKR